MKQKTFNYLKLRHFLFLLLLTCFFCDLQAQNPIKPTWEQLYIMGIDSVLLYNSEKGFAIDSMRVFSIEDENTMFRRYIPVGCLIYSISTSKLYLTGYNKPLNTINNGITKFLPEINGNIYITKETMGWLIEQGRSKKYGL